MADLSKVLLHLEKAELEIKNAQASMSPITQIRQVDAYILGILRASAVQIKEAKEAIMQSADFRSRKKTPKEKEQP